MADLLADLAELDGEQLYNLLGHLITAELRADMAELEANLPPATRKQRQELATELTEVRCLALAQIARVTVPIREAVQVIYRARYARTHPVRVPGT